MRLLLHSVTTLPPRDKPRRCIDLALDLRAKLRGRQRTALGDEAKFQLSILRIYFVLF